MLNYYNIYNNLVEAFSGQICCYINPLRSMLDSKKGSCGLIQQVSTAQPFTHPAHPVGR